MMNVVVRLLLALSLAMPSVVVATDSVDTTWLLDNIHAELKSQAAWQAMENCKPASDCLRLHDEQYPLDIFSAPPYPPNLRIRHFPSPEDPWFLTYAQHSTVLSLDVGDNYEGTSLIRSLRSLEVLSLISFWEGSGAQLFLGINESGILGMHLRPAAKSQTPNPWIGNVKSLPRRSSIVPISAFAH